MKIAVFSRKIHEIMEIFSCGCLKTFSQVYINTYCLWLSLRYGLPHNSVKHSQSVFNSITVHYLGREPVLSEFCELGIYPKTFARVYKHKNDLHLLTAKLLDNFDGIQWISTLKLPLCCGTSLSSHNVRTMGIAIVTVGGTSQLFAQTYWALFAPTPDPCGFCPCRSPP